MDTIHHLDNSRRTCKRDVRASVPTRRPRSATITLHPKVTMAQAIDLLATTGGRLYKLAKFRVAINPNTQPEHRK